jgi:hypothetical protein
MLEFLAILSQMMQQIAWVMSSRLRKEIACYWNQNELKKEATMVGHHGGDSEDRKFSAAHTCLGRN